MLDLGLKGRPVDIGSIEQELRQSWYEDARQAAQDTPGAAIRTSVLNLIVHTSTPEEVARVERALEGLGAHHPSRAIVLLAQDDAADEGLQAWISARVLTAPGSPRRLRFEQVTIAARGESARHLPTVVDPILVPELPTMLWWLREPPFRSARFTQMIDIVGRLIVDSATFSQPAAAFHELAELAVIPYGVAVSDFAWGRLRPWRELVAQFFDPPEQAASLAGIERVEITYEPHGPDGVSGFSEGILALGWLCSRLGWQIEDLARSTDPGAFEWQLHGPRGPVAAALRPQPEPGAVVGLRRLALTAGGRHPGLFLVHREGEAHLVTNVDVPGVPHLDQLMRATLPDERDLLQHDLAQFGNDRFYDGALVFAAQLCRGIEG